MEDADIVYAPDTFQRLIRETELLEETPFNFLSIPTIYVAEGPSAEVITTGYLTETMAERLVTKMLVSSPLDTAEGIDIQHFIPASGLILTRRDTALGVGAYDEAFQGWGGEDRDFIYRLLHANPQLNRPASFYATINDNMNRIHEFKGWRAAFRLHGDYLAAKGIYAFHLYHPKLGWKNQEGTRANIAYAAQKAADIAKSKIIIPFSRPDAQPDIVLGTNPHVANVQVYSALDNPTVVPEDTASAPLAFAQSIADRKPASVIVWNPYGLDWRLRMYKELQRLGVRTLVAERGALPWSLYFDTSMSITSDSYSESNWNRPNTPEEDDAVDSYIDDLRYGDVALEKQNHRVGGSMLRHTLQIAPHTKVLFAPLQLETDTVTNHFSERGRTYQDYIKTIRELSVRLPNGWVLAYKNHPLNLTTTTITSAICLDKYHINDILEACDAVALFNSGTGILSMAFEKPAFYFGPVFYPIDGVNRPFGSAAQMRRSLTDLEPVDRTKVRRFFRYLTQEFYSFADWKAETKPAGHGKALVPKVNYLYYRSIQLPGHQKLAFPQPMALSTDSVLMDRFRMSQKAPPAPIASQAPARLPAAAARFSPSQWSPTKRAIHNASIVILGPTLNERDRDRLKDNPIDFFQKAKWWPNRFFGRILLDKSQRPY